MGRFKYIEIIKDEDGLVVKRINVSRKKKSGITRLHNIMINQTNTALFSIKLNEYDNTMPVKDNPYNEDYNI